MYDSKVTKENLIEFVMNDKESQYRAQVMNIHTCYGHSVVNCEDCISPIALDADVEGGAVKYKYPCTQSQYIYICILLLICFKSLYIELVL